MGLFDRQKQKPKKLKDNTVREIQIQASAEGSKNSVLIESMLTAETVNVSIPGTINAYKNYENQVRETYRKYNSRSDFGNQQTRALVDFRTSFIAGEGINISADNPQTGEWIEKLITENKLNGIKFIDAVKGTEMAGQTLIKLSPFETKTGELSVKLQRVPYQIDRPYRPIYDHPLYKENVIGIEVKNSMGEWVKEPIADFEYIITGGDDQRYYGATTKTGILLTDLENYDRALKDIRRNNHVSARITPTFKTQSDNETKSLKQKLTAIGWKIGTAFIGTADFSYKAPPASAHEALTTEMTVTLKTISSVSSVPVHWLGYVDLMSNRSTADSLYEVIKNGTATERMSWSDALYNIILKAQEIYINNGGTDLSFDPNFSVNLPLISFENFLEKVRAMSLAFGDRAISMDDYRNGIPGIDPIKTDRAVENENKNILEGAIDDRARNQSDKGRIGSNQSKT